MHLAYCGFNCQDCPVYQATTSQDEGLRAAILAQYQHANPHLTLEDLFCHGCKSNSADNTHLCKTCEMRCCCRAKNLITCANCNDYPCAIIERALPLESAGRSRLDALVE